jgi:hypothetical protein
MEDFAGWLGYNIGAVVAVLGFIVVAIRGLKD